MRTRTGAFFALVLLAAGDLAAAQPCPAVQVRNPEGNYIVPGVRGDIPYAGDLALDAYAQPGSTLRPGVIVVHGGWTAGSRSAHVGQLLELLTRAGYNWFSIDYRLRGVARVEESLADVRAAVAFVRCRAREFQVDPENLVLLGEDAGADLAGLLAAERPAGVRGAVLIGGLYEPAVTAFARDRMAGAAPSDDDGKAPALLVIHGGDDRDVPVERAQAHCQALREDGHGCRAIEVPGASHRVENWWPRQWTYKRELVQWLSALAPAGPPAALQRAGRLQKNIVYDPSLQLTLDAYVPGGPPGPAVILVHGGGWEAGDKVTYITPLFEPLARAGLAWLSIDYRLTPAVTHEEQLADLRAAIRFVRAEHARFNVDPARIVLVGESASGQMVAQVAAEDRGLAGVVSFYGVYDFTAMVKDASPRSLLVRLFRRSVLDDESRAVLRRYSPLHRAHDGMPPMLLVAGTADPLWAQTRAFAARLAQRGVRHEVVALEGAPHGMENWEGRPEWLAWKRRVVEWIGGLSR